MSKRIDLSNKRFGKLVVIRYQGNKKYPCGSILTYWLCRCDCGKETTASTSSLKRGHKQSCGCLMYQSGNKSKLWGGYGEISGNHFCVMKECARVRGLRFDLNLQYLWRLFLKQKRRCALSGQDIFFNSRGGKRLGTSSLDRINSNKGYVRGNVQWIHKDINKMKWDFKEDYFIETCKKIAKFKKG